MIRYFSSTDVGIELEQSLYTFNEGDGTVLVCAIIDFLSALDLERNIVATLHTMDGSKAGNSVYCCSMLECSASVCKLFNCCTGSST